MGQFADDLWSTITPQSINPILDELNKFRSFSGLKTNPEKCTVLRIGVIKDDSDIRYYTLKKLFWSQD